MEKFTYLGQSLVGEPLSLLLAMEISADNYDLLVEQLKERYGRTETKVNLLWRKLNSLPSPRHQEPDLTNFHTAYKNILAQLERLEGSAPNRGAVYTQVHDKLHWYTWEEIYRYTQTDEPTLQEIDKGLVHCRKVLKARPSKKKEIRDLSQRVQYIPTNMQTKPRFPTATRERKHQSVNFVHCTIPHTIVRSMQTQGLDA